MSLTTQQRRARAEVLSRRINLVLDADETVPRTYPEIRAALEVIGVTLSRVRWSNLKNGTTTAMPSPALLTALGEVLGVGPDYLSGETATVPAPVRNHEAELIELRRQRVYDYAVRNLAEVDPSTLDSITQRLSNTVTAF